jgi:hypothetical protein
MPFGKVLVKKMYEAVGGYSCKNYQNRKKPIPLKKAAYPFFHNL